MDDFQKKANAFYYGRRFEEALSLFEKLLDSGKADSEQIRYQMGMCYFYLKRIPEALEAFNASLNIRPSKEAYLMKALCLYKMGEIRFAAEAYNRYAEALRSEGSKPLPFLDSDDEDKIEKAFTRLEFEPRPLKLSVNAKSVRSLKKSQNLLEKSLKERVRQLYEEGRDGNEISLITAVPKEKVERLLEEIKLEEEEEFEEFRNLREKLQVKRRGKNLRLKEVENLLEEGFSIQEIAERLSLSYQQVNYRIKKGNIRPGLRRKKKKYPPAKAVRGRFDYEIQRSLCMVCGRETIHHVLFKGGIPIQGTCTSCGEGVEYLNEEIISKLNLRLPSSENDSEPFDNARPSRT